MSPLPDVEGFLESTLSQQLLNQLAPNGIGNIARVGKLSNRFFRLPVPREKSSESDSHFVALNLCQLFRQLHVAPGYAPGQIDETGNQLWITLRGLAQVLECSLVFAPSQEHIPAVPTRLGIERSASNCFIEGRQGARGVARLVSQKAKLGPEAIVGRPQGNRALQFDNCLVGCAG